MGNKNKESKPMQARVTFMTKHFKELEELHTLGFDIQKIMSELLERTLPIKLRQVKKEIEIKQRVQEELIKEILKEGGEEDPEDKK